MSVSIYVSCLMRFGFMRNLRLVLVSVFCRLGTAFSWKWTATSRVGADEIATAFFKTVKHIDRNLAVVSNATAFVSSESFANLTM